MIVRDPKSREPAWKCLHRALRLRVQGRSLTSTPTFYSFQQPQIGNDYQGTVVDCRFEDCTATRQEDPPGSIRDSEIQRYIRSNASLHSSAQVFVEKRKRSSRSAASSASSRKHTKKSLAASSSIRQSSFTEGLPRDLNCAATMEHRNNSLIQGRDAFERSPDVSQGTTEHKQITELTWTESLLTAHLLHEIRNS